MKTKTPRDDFNELVFQHNVLRIRVATLEAVVHTQPEHEGNSESSGHFECQNCGRDWGDDDIRIDRSLCKIGGGTGCGKYAVKWIAAEEDAITRMQAAYPHVDYSEKIPELPKDDGFSDAAIANLKEADKLELQEDAITTMKLTYLPVNYDGTIDKMEQAVELIACRKEVAKLRAEVKRLSKRDCNATISLAYSTPDEPFAREDLTVVDVGVSDNHYVVTSDIFDKLKAVQDGSARSEEVARLENRIYNLEANQKYDAKVIQQLRASQNYSEDEIRKGLASKGSLFRDEIENFLTTHRAAKNA